MSKKRERVIKSIERNLKIIIALAVFGILVSSYLTFSHYSEEKDPFCDALGGGCEIVNKGTYSELDGIINEQFGTYIDFPVPVSIIGIIGFLTTIVISFMILRKVSWRIGSFRLGTKQLVSLMFWLNLLGFIFAVYLTYIEFIVLETFCPYCDVTKITFTIVLILCGINLYIIKKRGG